MNIEPSQGLFKKIMKRIHREERFLAIRKNIFFSITFVISTGSFIPAFKMLLSDFSESGFLSFFSLIFSDFSIISVYWKNFALILLETLPVFSIAVFLVILLVFLQSLKSLSKNIKIINRNQLAVN
jgi:hypothetical protein